MVIKRAIKKGNIKGYKKLQKRERKMVMKKVQG